jgi:HD-GYP domain-containing protein (c-di-GMP phosphodiesterase class II)
VNEFNKLTPAQKEALRSRVISKCNVFLAGTGLSFEDAVKIMQTNKPDELDESVRRALSNVMRECLFPEDLL